MRWAFVVGGLEGKEKVILKLSDQRSESVSALTNDVKMAGSQLAPSNQPRAAPQALLSPTALIWPRVDVVCRFDLWGSSHRGEPFGAEPRVVELRRYSPGILESPRQGFIYSR